MVSKVVSGLSIAIGVLGLLVLQTCSSGSGPRDQNWGSDVGRGYDAGAPPSDAGASPSDDAQEDSQDASQDESTAPDASTATETMDGLSIMDTAVGSDADGVSDGETMDGEAMTAQYTGGSQGREGAAP